MQRRDFVKLGIGAAVAAVLPAATDTPAGMFTEFNPAIHCVELDDLIRHYNMSIYRSPIITRESRFSEICQQPGWEGLPSAELDTLYI